MDYNDQGPSMQNSYGYNAGIFYRKYRSVAPGLFIFGEGALGGNFEKYESGDTQNRSVRKTTSGQLSFSPGIAYQLFKFIQLEIAMYELAGIQYGSSRTTYAQGIPNKSSSFSFNTSLNGGLFQNLGAGFKIVL